MKTILAVVAVLVMGVAFSANAQQSMSTTQAIYGHSSGGWSFMTAWNLSTGAQNVSGSWYDGDRRFEHPAPSWRQWIARFIYNQSTGRTAALAWYYDQPHVQ